jgi:hypothetical protein
MSEASPLELKLVTIATFPEPMEANMARSVLEGAGIPVWINGETANTMVPIAFTAQLQVAASNEAAAREILQQMEDSPESLETVTAAEVASHDLPTETP